MTVKDYDPKYESLVKVLTRAYDRAAVGKGRDHHSLGELFEKQWICRGARLFGLGGLQFQIGKKNEQVIKLKTNAEKINELLDIINYAAAGVIVLDEDENQELTEMQAVAEDGHFAVSSPGFIPSDALTVEELILSTLHSKSISKSQCEVLFERFPNLKIVDKYRIELLQHIKL